MFEPRSTSAFKYFLPLLMLFLLVVDIFLVKLDYRASHRGLTFAMLDVGQGDALFVESPTGTQVLIDAGAPARILRAMSRVMSPFDRTLDAVIMTNPDSDHIAGFLDIFKNYQVGKVFEPGTVNDSKTYQSIEEEIKNKNIPYILARRGMRLDLGGGALIEILFPDRDVYTWANNDGSVVAKLIYGKTSIMLMGDATVLTEKIVLQENTKGNLRSDILKVAHHGSRTSTSPGFVKAVSPSLALISVGGDNKYGHPHPETLDTLTAVGAKILRTDILGTIIFNCDIIGKCEIQK